MTSKRIFQSILVVVILVVSFASTGGALALSGCAGFVTVQQGDTLGVIATACGTTIEAIIAANPELGQLPAGQVIYIPTGYTSASYYPSQTGGNNYVVLQGDILSDIAVRNGVSLGGILAVNPQIWNANLIYPGQVIYLPNSINGLPPTYNPYNCNPSSYNPAACNPFTYTPSAYTPYAYNPYNCTPSPSNPTACDPYVYNPSAYNPPAYDPTACTPSPYNLTACDPDVYNPYSYNSSTNNQAAVDSAQSSLLTLTYYTPTPSDYSGFSGLKINYGHGLLVRTGPGISYSEIKSPFVSADKWTHWWYRRNSVTVDSTGLVWVEVKLSQAVNGSSTGWIMVKDMLGNYFTRPNIDPK